MGFLELPVLGLATIAGIIGLTISGVADMATTARRWRRNQPWHLPLARGGIKLVLTTLLASVPLVAADYAEESNHWVDSDRNGMLDPDGQRLLRLD